LGSLNQRGSDGKGKQHIVERRNTHTSLIGKSEKKRTLGKSRADTGGKY
jgi:hypothetical protein